MLKIFFVRHGETTANQIGIMLGHKDGELSPLGKEQAKRTGQFLADEKFSVIYSSDLNRSKETTEYLSSFHPDVPVVYTSELRERFLGKYEGTDKHVYGWTKEFQTFALNDPFIESREALFARAKKFLDFLMEHHENETVLISSHSAFGKAFLAVITQYTPEYVMDAPRLSNASVSAYEIYPDKSFKEVYFNYDKHLSSINKKEFENMMYIS